ncbi:ribonuclease HI family protein [Candidatus Sumerlaeota bacterium]|nr:ribonuclease HI family protein [Candidatus Sumerlaeota bacterium]
MSRLPPYIAQLAKKTLYVKGTRVPVYKLLDILATPDGDISKIANLFPDINEPSLRQAFHNCAQLLKALHPTSAPSPDISTPTAEPSVTRGELHPDADKLLSSAERIKIYVDGTTRGNPGPSALAFVFKDIHDNLLLKEGMFIGEATNNITEARAIIAALSRALQLGKKKVHLFSDSELLVNQITGRYKIRNPELIKLHKKIRALIKQFDSFQILKIDRTLNKDADKLANSILKQALDEK